MRQRMRGQLWIAVGVCAVLSPSAYPQALDRDATVDFDAEQRREYNTAQPKDDIRDDVRPMMPGAERMLGARGPARSSHASTKLLDSGPITTRPLVILMDFPDYRYYEFLEKEVWILYESDSYEAWHYAEMLFNDETYQSPNGENFISMNKYYYDESRGLLSIKGDVHGWYTAERNAAFYGSDEGDGTEQDNASILVVEAIEALAREQGVDLTSYDLIDRHDFDNDGNLLEPDGMIDSIILIHAGRGEEWNGGSLGADAIWPFRGKISYYNETHTPHPVVDAYGNAILAEDFLIVEQDTPLGLVVHEYGHDFGLPDLYGYEEPVQKWSVMASGYTGLVIGSMPTGLGAYCKQRLQEKHGGDWQRQTHLHLDDLEHQGVDITLQASTVQDSQTDAIRIDLPPREKIIALPYSGRFMYYSTKGNYLQNSMVRSFDFTDVKSASPVISLSFKTWYKIESHYDYASIQAREQGATDWTPLVGNITTDENPYGNNPGQGITGSTNDQWVDAQFDLSAYAGKKIDLRFYYWTDTNTILSGMFIDDIAVRIDGREIFFDDAEGTARFLLNGFKLDNGILVTEHYYLVEWRNHRGVDEGLKYTSYRSAQTSYDPGLIIWYIDKRWGTKRRLDQNAYRHPGSVSVGVVDADQNPIVYETYDGSFVIPDYTTYQMRDAAFSLRRGGEFVIYWWYGATIDKNISMIHPVFDDSRDYTNPAYPMSGLILPQFGLKLFVTEENSDRSAVKLHIMKGDGGPHANDDDDDDDDSIVDEIVAMGDRIVVEADEDLGQHAFVSFVSNDPQRSQVGIELSLEDDEEYVGMVGDPDILDPDLWTIDFIVFDDEEGGRKAVFNSDVYFGYGTPLRVELDDD